MTQPAQTAKHLVVTGRVQGVGFRYFMTRAAKELRITGWVRNRLDGSVEAIIAGEPAAVDAMIERARRGPQKSTVMDVKISLAHGSFEGFEMLPTE